MISTTYWKDRNVFVTGASGFLGSHLCKALIDVGANVTALVRDQVPKSLLYTDGHVRRMNVVRGDLSDRDLLERILGEYEISVIFHLAAQTIVEIANRNPVSTFESNIRGSWNLFEAARRTPTIERVIVASSDKAYGVHNTLPYTEEFALQGSHPYDVSKSAVDLIAQTYANTYHMPIAITRCGNLFGGGDLNFSRLIPGTIRSAIRGEQPILRSDGSFVRDYFYVLDAVNAYVTLAEKMADSKFHGHAFNFSPENQISALELVRTILRLMESDLEPIIKNEVKHEIPHQYLSSTKARELLGWAPLYSLEDGLKESIAWYRNFLK